MDLGSWPFYAMLVVMFGFTAKLITGGYLNMNWLVYPLAWIVAPIVYFISKESEPKNDIKLELEFETPKEVEPKKDEVLSKSDWDIICAQAVEQAKQGNASARNWVTKNIIEKESEKLVAEELKTDAAIVSEAIEGLVSLGWKKKDATKTVKEAACAKEYKSVEDLLVFVHKK